MNTLVSVKWTDSGMHIDHGWDTLEKYKADLNPGITEVQTVGILMHEDGEMMIVGLSCDPSHDKWFGAQMILKSNVISVDMVTIQNSGGIT